MSRIIANVQEKVQGSVAVNKAFTTGEVSLFMFTPTMHTTQVVRPYKYNFTDSVVGEMVNNDTINGKLDNLNKCNDEVLRSVVPDARGMVVHTRNLQEAYTFFMVTTDKVPSANMLQGSGTTKRRVFAGYFLGEPPFSTGGIMLSGGVTPHINHEAKMIFTHVESLNEEVSYGRGGANTSISMLGSVDMVHVSDGAKFSDQVGFCDYSKMAGAHGRDILSQNLVRNGNPLYLSELSAGQGISDAMKSPRSHMKGIADAASDSVGDLTNVQIHSAINNEFGLDDPRANAAGSMLARMQQPSMDQSIASIIDPQRPTTIRELAELCPGIKLFPCETSFNPEYEIADATMMSAENTMSSMVGNTVAAYARSLVIASCAFTYKSYVQIPGSPVRGEWVPKACSSIVTPVGTDPNAMTQKLMRDLHMMLTTGLFPILIAHNGEFELMVNFDSTGDTSVWLHYKDEPMNNGFIVTHNRMGGLLSPTLGTQNDMTSNRAQVNGLVNRVVAHIPGADDHSQYQGHMPFSQGPEEAIPEEYSGIDLDTGWADLED